MSIKLIWKAANGLFGTDTLPSLDDALRSKRFMEREGCQVTLQSCETAVQEAASTFEEVAFA